MYEPYPKPHSNYDFCIAVIYAGRDRRRTVSDTAVDFYGATLYDLLGAPQP
jgi:hypothetical protein